MYLGLQGVGVHDSPLDIRKVLVVLKRLESE
jgi:hypothetical protein